MNITLADKTVEIRLSARATRALAERESPLLAEMELLFSCLIRKRVRFGDLAMESVTTVSDRLSVSFRPVMTRVCAISDLAGSPPMEDFPVANPRPYVPRWLAIDYRRGEWFGEFGY
jgi:hypothetical protein